MISDIIYEMTKINAGDTTRINHALKVYGLAKCIAGCEHVDESTMQVIETAAVLHDIAIAHCERHFGRCGGKLQEKHGPPIARAILEKYTDDASLIDRVCHLIAHHHTYNSINGIDYQILIEADFLVNAQEGDITMDAFQTVLRKVFRTETGKALAVAMFGTRS